MKLTRVITFLCLLSLPLAFVIGCGKHATEADYKDAAERQQPSSGGEMNP